jgi:hypothetical protein
MNRKAAAIPISFFHEAFFRNSPRMSVKPTARKKYNPTNYIADAMPAVPAANRKFHPKRRLSRLRKNKVKTTNNNVIPSGCHHRLF